MLQPAGALLSHSLTAAARPPSCRNIGPLHLCVKTIHILASACTCPCMSQGQVQTSFKTDHRVLLYLNHAPGRDPAGAGAWESLPSVTQMAPPSLQVALQEQDCSRPAWPTTHIELADALESRCPWLDQSAGSSLRQQRLLPESAAMSSWELLYACRRSCTRPRAALTTRQRASMQAMLSMRSVMRMTRRRPRKTC